MSTSEEDPDLPIKRKVPLDAAGLRRRAEIRLGEQRSEITGQARSVAGARRLLNELQVHQVELEMQNAELQETRDRLEALLEKYTDLYDFAPVGYFSLDEQGRILEVNLTGAAMLGVDRSRLIDRRFQQFVAPTSRPCVAQYVEQIFAGAGKQGCEAKLLKKGGTAFWADFHAASAISLNGTQRSCRVAVSNIADLKRAEEAQRRVDSLAAANQEANREIARRREVEASLRESEQTQRGLVTESRELHAQLRRMTHQLLLAQEEERKEISRELHDEIAQLLAGINVQLAALVEVASIRPLDLPNQIARTQILVKQSVEVVHRYARRLRPALLDDLGLIPALRSYIKDLPGRKGLRIRFMASAGVEALDNIRRTVLFRVAQESLTNVTRHANARLVKVRLQQTPDAVCLEVHDDGKSFEVDGVLASNTKKRLGLLGMRERVEMVGGNLAIKSKPGKGTTVRAEIPFQGHRRGANP